MAYDWTAPLPGCDVCGESDEESSWLDQDDFWGHEDCYWTRRRAAHRVIVEAEVRYALEH